MMAWYFPMQVNVVYAQCGPSNDVTHGHGKNLKLDCHFVEVYNQENYCGHYGIHRGSFEMMADWAHITIDSQVYVGTVLHFTSGFLKLRTNKTRREYSYIRVASKYWPEILPELKIYKHIADSCGVLGDWTCPSTEKLRKIRQVHLQCLICYCSNWMISIN